MNITPIPRPEATVKFSFAFKQSTSEFLTKYQKLYAQTHGDDVSMKDLIEQILIDFMAADKSFQKYLKQSQVQTQPTSSAVPATVAGSSGENSGADELRSMDLADI